MTKTTHWKRCWLIYDPPPRRLAKSPKRLMNCWLNSSACGRVEPKRGEGEVVGNADALQRNPPRMALRFDRLPALPIVPIIDAPLRLAVRASQREDVLG